MNWKFWERSQPSTVLPTTNPLVTPLRALHRTLSARVAYHETTRTAALADHRQEDYRLHTALLDNDQAVLTTLTDILSKS